MGTILFSADTVITALCDSPADMKRAKTIDELYEEVKDYDVVLCNDAPLMTALNMRTDVPRVGDLATTPRRIARKESHRILGEGIWDDLRIVSHISRETGYDIRFVHGEVENIRTIRRYTKEVERHLYGRSARIYRIYRELPTEERVMDSFDADKEGLFFGNRVAVIGLDMFNDLDKHFIPRHHDEIDMFSGGSSEIGTIYESGNDRQMADGATALIDPERASDFAIVLDTSSPLADAVRASMYRKGIPFKNDLKARDLVQVRDYLEMVRLSLSFDTVRAGQVRELFSACGGDIPIDYDEYLLDRIPEHLDGRSLEIWECMRDIRARTFSEACDILIVNTSGGSDSLYRSPIRTLLGNLGVKDSLISEDAANSLEYTINSMEPKHNEQIPDDERNGVIIADCGNALYVDRPAVLFLGLGQNWYRPPRGKRYMDWEDERERNALRFSVLLQQGDARIYMVNSMKDGRPPRPCVLFDDILGKDVRRFDDIGTTARGYWGEGSPERLPPRTAVPASAREMHFTKSSLNSFMECPRRFMFGMLTRSPSGASAFFGILVHEFAEFCLCYPSYVKENGIRYYEDLLWERYSKMVSEERREVERCRLRIALTNISHFLDSLDIEVPMDRTTRNPIMEHHGLPSSSSAAESRRSSSKVPLYGTFDLLAGGTIVDYKTGRMKDAKEVKEDMGPKAEYREYQALVYLSILDDAEEGRKVFRIFNVLGNPEAALSGDPDLEGCFVDVVADGTTFEDFVRTGLRDAPYIPQKVRDNWGRIADRMVELGPPGEPEDWMSDRTLQERIADANKGTYKRTLKSLAEAVSGWAVTEEDRLTVLKERMEEFREFVKRKHSEMTAQRSGVMGADTERCGKCRYFHLCTVQGGADE